MAPGLCLRYDLLIVDSFMLLVPPPASPPPVLIAQAVQLLQNFDPRACLIYTAKYCFSQPLIPVLLIGDVCPSGFFASKGYCIPLTRDVPGVIPVFTREIPPNCPPGFYRNNGYCQVTPGTRKSALPMFGEECPLGFYREGHYCIKACTPYTQLP
jgi:hypothetical protein